jgi:hypothetical protein
MTMGTGQLVINAKSVLYGCRAGELEVLVCKDTADGKVQSYLLERRSRESSLSVRPSIGNCRYSANSDHHW